MQHGADYAEIAREQDLKPEWVIPGWNRLQAAGYRLRTTDDLIGELRRLKSWRKRDDGTEWQGMNPEDLLEEIKKRTGTRPGMSLKKGLDFYIDLKTRLPEYAELRRKAAIQYAATRANRSPGQTQTDTLRTMPSNIPVVDQVPVDPGPLTGANVLSTPLSLPGVQ